jgi:hypothetical protein
MEKKNYNTPIRKALYNWRISGLIANILATGASTSEIALKRRNGYVYKKPTLADTDCIGFTPREGGYKYDPNKADKLFVEVYDPIKEKEIRERLESLLERYKEGKNVDEEIYNALGEAYDARFPCTTDYHIKFIKVKREKEE